jgi:hypothetical protein
VDKAALKAEKQGLARRTASGGLRGRLSMLYIVLDDVGFSALTPYGGLIQTPNIKPGHRRSGSLVAGMLVGARAAKDLENCNC